jgi:signal transduction histidine kinase
MISTEARADNQAELLLHAFNSFNEVSSALQSAYHELQTRVERLSRELEQSNYYLRTVLQSLPCGVLVVDQDGSVTLMNEAARELFAMSAAEPPIPLATVLDRASFSERAGMLRDEGGTTTEITFPGDPEKTLHCCWSGLRDGERVLVVQDLTRLRQLERRMRETERLAAMGEMALEVAHEIRNPLGALELFASLLAEDDLDPEDRARYVANVQIGIRSLNTVVTNMLCVRKSPAPNLEDMPIGEVVEEVVALMRPLLRQRGIKVSFDLQARDDLPLDREMMRQVFTNLVTNAMQALPEGGGIAVRTFVRGESVFAEIEDDGCGIPKRYQRLIFDSGFTTSRGGTGLGLAIVRRFLDVLGGDISVDGDEGLGTRFTLTFPKRKRDA